MSIHGRKRARKIDTSPLLPFTYDDILYILTEEKKASGAAVNNARGRCNRRVNAGCTLNRNSSVPPCEMGRERSVDIRELKALEIAARSKITFDGKHWLVPSQTNPSGKYRVILGTQPSCECEDFQLRGTGKDSAFFTFRLIASVFWSGLAAWS